MGWRAFPDHQRKLLFFWSQKAACTTLFHFLAANMATPPEKKQYFVLHSLPFRMCQDLIRDRGFRSVAVVRHPVPRIVSAYLNKFVVHYGRPLRRHAGLEPFARELHQDICKVAGRERGDNLTSFEEFLAAVARLHAGREDPWQQLDGHWDTQTPPRLTDTGFAYDHIIRVENLDADFTAFAAQEGMTYTPTVLNKTEFGAAEPQRRYLGGMSARQLQETPYRPENFMNVMNLSVTQLIFAPDYQRFGYAPLPEGWTLN